MRGLFIGEIMIDKLVYGVGVNDISYQAYLTTDGTRAVCPFYARWFNLIGRCYGVFSPSRSKAYAECYVCDEWLIFSNFKKWMEQQDWQGKELDKDIILKGNKVYSPKTCAFVDSATNAFVLDSKSTRGKLPIGVDFHKSNQKIRARCSNPFTKKSEHLGYFRSEVEAHLAWKNRKHQLACQLADRQSDIRVAEALRVRYV